MMRIISTLLLLVIGLQAFAQSLSDGVYNTNYGKINLTFEVGYEYPNGGMVYGDYKDNGTITGSTINVGKEISGSFHNGAAEGKFIFFSPSGKQHFFDSGITSFNGNWGYATDNKYSTNPDHSWKATSKTAGKDAIKNVTNVWSGKWNTTDGNLILQQIGNKVTGTYKGIGTVTATYAPQNKKLKGTFYNNNTKKTGHFEFNFEGNSFKGKWGWTTAMTDGVWNGTKHVKTNKEVVVAVNSTSSTSSSSQTTNGNQNKTVKLKFVLETIFAGDIPNLRSPELYGFVGMRLFRVTSNGREEIKSFGNKAQNFFNKTENNPFLVKNIHDYRHDLPLTPDYFREFTINQSDLNNPDVDIEVEVWHHIKAKIIGPNYDFKYHKEVVNFENITDYSNNQKLLTVGKSYENSKSISTTRNSFIYLRVYKN